MSAPLLQDMFSCKRFIACEIRCYGLEYLLRLFHTSFPYKTRCKFSCFRLDYAYPVGT